MEEKGDEIMLPGFRFRPTDEELVGFYLKRKVQRKPLSVELINQLDIYKYDPWDLPQLAATTDAREWYFYCPRDRKYRNSARPNRVTASGFWKATGTDRPIYSTKEAKCIGLKKSLVFYRGRAAKGIKTDWMMHEFRIPFLNDSVSRNPLDNVPLVSHEQESWAICRIFKKANTWAQRALSQSWISLQPEAVGAYPSSSPSSRLDATHSKQNSFNDFKSSEIARTLMFSQCEKTSSEEISVLLNFSTAVLEDEDKHSQIINFGQRRHYDDSKFTFPLEANGKLLRSEGECVMMPKKTPLVDNSGDQLGNLMGAMNFPFNLKPNACDEWRLTDLSCVGLCTPPQ